MGTLFILAFPLSEATLKVAGQNLPEVSVAAEMEENLVILQHCLECFKSINHHDACK